MDDEQFCVVRYTLDDIMKDKCAHGIGTIVRQVQVLSFTDKDLLWQLGLLGTDHPQQLLNMVVFMFGLSCALRAGKEHRTLHSLGFKSQLSFHYDNNGRRYLLYREDIGGKTNKGGLKHCKVDPKIVSVYSSKNPYRCPVAIVDKYMSKLPLKRKTNALYLRLKANYSPTVWYVDRPVGVNTLQSVVNNVCKEAGLNGYFTNHSLRATSATRMYQSNLPEQVIQETTGHRSLAIRSYQKTSENQKRKASEAIFIDPNMYDEDNCVDVTEVSTKWCHTINVKTVFLDVVEKL